MQLQPIVLQPISQPIVVRPFVTNPPPYNPIYSVPIHSNPPPYNPIYTIPFQSQPVKNDNIQPKIPQKWNSGLCSFCEDFGICFQGLVCPCCLYGLNSEKLNSGSCFTNCLCYIFCFPCCQEAKNRSLLRQKFNLLSEPCDDCLVSWFCTSCSLCQVAREIKFQSLNKPSHQTMT
jgi:Cys-rich protein (TIGR01571 family)